MDKYILDENGNPQREPDLITWAKWMEENGRKLARHEIGRIVISTVFLGSDHRFSLEEAAEPLLWETMIFGGEHDEYQERYSSIEAALKGHNEAVQKVRASAN